MDFKEYARDVQAKYREDADAVLLPNRIKMWRMALRPLAPRLRSARRILDFGCGAGEFLSFLALEYPQAEVVGFDPSESQLELARRRIGANPRVTASATLPSVTEKFDLVFSQHVVEHIPDGELHAYMGRMIERLRPDGRIMISTPNGLNPFAYAFFMSTDRTHLRMHSVFTLNELVRPFGYEVESFHRETPQAYDLMTTLKTWVWWVSSQFLRLGILSSAAGVRGFRFRFELWPTFYVVIARSAPASAST